MLKDFAGLYGFELDDFQVRACREIEDGRGVLVAAPTGSGKTIVGEFAIHLALADRPQGFYTTPIKALSNQKYHDLVRRYGADNVGLLTGDNVINGEAPGGRDDHRGAPQHAVRRLAHAARPRLRGDGRGALPRRPDARRGLGGGHHPPARSRSRWCRCRRRSPTPRSSASGWPPSAARPPRSWRRSGRCRCSSTSWSGARLLDLFASSDVDASAGFVKEGAPVNDELTRIARDDWASSRLMRDRRSPRKGKPGSSKNPRAVGNGRRVWIPSRVDVVERLDREGLLPAIVFIFSRAGCDAAVTQCLQANTRLTTAGRARRDLRPRRGGARAPARGGPARPRLPRVPRRAHPRHRRPPRRHAARVQAGASRSCSRRAWSRSSSRPRRSPSASTCPPARSSSRSCRSGTARPTPT